jgi:hypothetical protein
MTLEQYEDTQRKAIINAGGKPVRAEYDAQGNCLVCGESGRCPGWHDGTSDRAPGPWESPGTDGGEYVICAKVKGKRRTVAHVYSEANARLIAAAPELLEALNQVLNCPAMNEDSADPKTVEAYDRARAAIANAEGGAE